MLNSYKHEIDLDAKDAVFERSFTVILFFCIPCVVQPKLISVEYKRNVRDAQIYVQ